MSYGCGGAEGATTVSSGAGAGAGESLHDPSICTGLRFSSASPMSRDPRSWANRDGWTP